MTSGFPPGTGGVAYVHYLRVVEHPDGNTCQRAKRSQRGNGAVVSTRPAHVTCPHCSWAARMDTKVVPQHAEEADDGE